MSLKSTAEIIAKMLADGKLPEWLKEPVSIERDKIAQGRQIAENTAIIRAERANVSDATQPDKRKATR